MALGPVQYKPGLLQVRPHYNVSDVSGHTPQNVLWFVSANVSTPALGNLNTICNFVDQYWTAVCCPVMASANHYTGSIVTDFSSNTGLAYSSVGNITPIAGSLTGGSQSAQVCMLISYQIGVRWKGGHPRTYLPYIAESVTQGISGDEVVPTFITQMNTAMNTFISQMKATGVLGGQTLSIYRHKQNPALAQTYPVVTFSVSTQTATQRRRVRRVPHH